MHANHASKRRLEATLLEEPYTCDAFCADLPYTLWNTCPLCVCGLLPVLVVILSAAFRLDYATGVTEMVAQSINDMGLSYTVYYTAGCWPPAGQGKPLLAGDGRARYTSGSADGPRHEQANHSGGAGTAGGGGNRPPQCNSERFEVAAVEFDALSGSLLKVQNVTDLNARRVESVKVTPDWRFIVFVGALANDIGNLYAVGAEQRNARSVVSLLSEQQLDKLDRRCQQHSEVVLRAAGVWPAGEVWRRGRPPLARLAGFKHLHVIIPGVPPARNGGGSSPVPQPPEGSGSSLRYRAAFAFECAEAANLSPGADSSGPPGGSPLRFSQLAVADFQLHGLGAPNPLGPHARGAFASAELSLVSAGVGPPPGADRHLREGVARLQSQACPRFVPSREGTRLLFVAEDVGGGRAGESGDWTSRSLGALPSRAVALVEVPGGIPKGPVVFAAAPNGTEPKRASQRAFGAGRGAQTHPAAGAIRSLRAKHLEGGLSVPSTPAPAPNDSHTSSSSPQRRPNSSGTNALAPRGPAPSGLVATEQQPRPGHAHEAEADSAPEPADAPAANGSRRVPASVSTTRSTAQNAAVTLVGPAASPADPALPQKLVPLPAETQPRHEATSTLAPLSVRGGISKPGAKVAAPAGVSAPEPQTPTPEYAADGGDGGGRETAAAQAVLVEVGYGAMPRAPVRGCPEFMPSVYVTTESLADTVKEAAFRPRPADSVQDGGFDGGAGAENWRDTFVVLSDPASASVLGVEAQVLLVSLEGAPLTGRVGHVDLLYNVDGAPAARAAAAPEQGGAQEERAGALPAPAADPSDRRLRLGGCQPIRAAGRKGHMRLQWILETLMDTFSLRHDRREYSTWLACLTADQRIAIVESPERDHWINMSVPYPMWSGHPLQDVWCPEEREEACFEVWSNPNPHD